MIFKNFNFSQIFKVKQKLIQFFYKYLSKRRLLFKYLE